MKKLTIATFLFLTSIPLTTCPKITIEIPNSVTVGGLVTAGTLTGAFSLLAARFAYQMIQEEATNSGKPEKFFHNSLTIGSGLAAITSGIVSYVAFKNACDFLA